MKKPIFILLMAFGMNVAAQADFKNNTFTTSSKTGYGAEKEIVFNALMTKEKILQCEEYKQTIKEYSDTLTEDQRINLFLRGKVTYTLIMGQMDLKKPNSMDFPDGARGVMFIDNSGMLAFDVPIKSQNGYGNYIYGKIIYMNGEVSVLMD
jgi:hypothetical protein